jgi:hypothetical protein
MMMEAASTSETSVNFYQTTRRNNSEDSYLHTLRRETLKSHSKASKFLVAQFQPFSTLLTLSISLISLCTIITHGMHEMHDGNA